MDVNGDDTSTLRSWPSTVEAAAKLRTSLPAVRGPWTSEIVSSPSSQRRPQPLGHPHRPAGLVRRRSALAAHPLDDQQSPTW